MRENTIAIIGLGYVGLPLAVAFAEKYRVIGFDIKEDRVKEIQQGIDSTLEVENKRLASVLYRKNEPSGLCATTSKNKLSECTTYIITVPTPTDKNNRPVLLPLYRASETVGEALKKGDIVIYESTVYPGVTEEMCVPILEKVSSLQCNTDFAVGYSPERINPGDKLHTVTKIKKVTSGSTPKAAEEIDQLYRSIIEAGTFQASSIKVAEAAKVIENSQRDINIAFVNELAKIFSLMGIDTSEVLEAAATKWNFLPFKPGLVGGHCIGVDPYYLAQKAQELGYHPEIILAGRRMNDGMGQYVSAQLVKEMVKKDIKVKNAKVLMLGITFKENCPDIRNTRAIDIVEELKQYDVALDVHDPWANGEEVKQNYHLELSYSPQVNYYDAVLIAVAHNDFLNQDVRKYLSNDGVVYDVKGILPKDTVDARL